MQPCLDDDTRTESAKRSVTRPKTFILLVVAVTVFSARLGSTAELTGKRLARKLVAQLGHEQFSIRERASLKLIELGMVGAEALRAGKASPNREIRYRSTKLYSWIAESDFQRRLEEFQHSEDPSEGYGLPGWDRYREEVGTDTTSRSLFQAMQEQERELLQAVGNPRELTRALTTRCEIILQNSRFGPQPQSVATVAALLFVATDPKVTITETSRAMVFRTCRDRDFIETIMSGKSRPALAKLVGNWITRDSDHDVWNVLYLGLITNVDTCLPYAKTVLEDPQADRDVRVCALLCFAKFGKRTDVPFLERFLEDKTVYGAAAQDPETRTRPADARIETQMRDIALATLVRVTEQKPLDYGFERMQLHRYEVFYPKSLGFATNGKRETAMAKWRVYRETDRDQKSE